MSDEIERAQGSSDVPAAAPGATAGPAGILLIEFASAMLTYFAHNVTGDNLRL